jgi:tetratricopeptide (TPR) repeat protein
MRHLKIFISSPMDVSSERTVAQRVIARLAMEYAYHFRIESVMSELEPMVATQTPQASVTPPSETDIVVTLLWSRLGTPLPADPRFAIDETRRPTGTEWEFYDAFRGHQEKGHPDLLVYRKIERATTYLDDEQQVLEGLRQKKELEKFLDRWFRGGDGSWKAWFHSFEKEDELEHLLDTHLRKLIDAKIEVDPRTDDAPTGKIVEGNPYRGLRSFDLKDAPLFFGRTRALNELREVLETQNALRRGFVIVTGGSGSGKSSLVKAGLLADLQNPHRIGRVSKVRHAIMRPTDASGQLMLAVAEAIMQPTAFPELQPVGWTTEDLARTGSQDPQRLVEALRHAAAVVARGARLRDATDVRLCLVIDQLEELFTAGIPPSAINEFTRLITLMARSEIVWVIATLRSDFYHRLDEVPDLQLLVERGYYRLKAPSPTELGQIICKPAQLAGLRFQKHPETGVGLDAVLQDDAVSDPTALALLEFALSELWNQRSADGLLTFEAYERMGRITGAIAERAEGMIATLSPDSQPHLAATLRALITVARADVSPTAATVHRSRIATSIERAEILDKLIEARLVVTDDAENRGDPKCRLAHEKLIETWPRLRKLAEADRAFLEIRARLRTAAESWAGKERKRDLLLPAGSQLQEGEDTLKTRRDELDALIIAFIETSRKADKEERSRRLRWVEAIAATFAILFATTMVMLLWSVEKKKDADVAAEQARRGYGLAVQATGILSESTGTAGADIEPVLTRADALFETAKPKTTPPTLRDPSFEVLVERASLLLKFAATNERLGHYAKMRERAMLARDILGGLCGGDESPDDKCRALLAHTYEVEGNYAQRVSKPKEAVRAYKLAMEFRPKATGVLSEGPLLTKAHTESLLSQAYWRDQAYDDAFKLGHACLETAKQGESVAPRASGIPIAFADCYLRIALAVKDRPKPDYDEALRHTSAALLWIRAEHGKDPANIAVVEKLSRTNQTMAEILNSQGRQEEATQYLEANKDLESAQRNNPQNEDLADLLQDILRMQDNVYRQLGKNHLAEVASKARADLAAKRIGSPRGDHWQSARLESLRSLGRTYSALRRPKDALAVSEQEIGLRREAFATNDDKPYPTETLQALLSAGFYAYEAKEGLKAYEFYRLVLEHAERHQIEAQRDGKASNPAYNNYIYRALLNLSYITGDMLPPERQVDVIDAIISKIERYTRAEPRVVTFHYALGRSLYQIASIYEVAGDFRGSFDAHKRASDVGWRQSTIVLNRWYHEGFKHISADAAKARELEVLAARQVAHGSPYIEVRNLTTNKLETEIVYLQEPKADDLPLSDEVYRLRKYYNVEITEEGNKYIERVYKVANEYNISVESLLKQVRNTPPSYLPRTDLDADLAEVTKLVEAKDLESANGRLTALRDKIGAKSNKPVLDSMQEWAVLAEHFAIVATESRKVQRTALAETSANDEAAAIRQVLAKQSEGSSPQLRHADRLEQLAGYVLGKERLDTAIAYYERAIALRQQVRFEDQKNAECACAIARVYEQISNIERSRGEWDKAIASMHRAYQIREDLSRQEPGNWSSEVARSALFLSEIYDEKGESRSALLYARQAAMLRERTATLHSADSAERQAYAAALEAIAQYAKAVGEKERGRANGQADLYFELAVEKLNKANEIRNSVLEVDPKNAECRCRVAANFSALGSIYQAWGKFGKWENSLAENVRVRRLVLAEEPGVPKWQYNLAEALDQLARSKDDKTLEGYQEKAKLYGEAGSLLEPLIKEKEFSETAANRLYLVSTSLSFSRLFTRDWTKAIEAAERAIELATDEANRLVSLTNKAHALMFLDRIQEALALYREHLGKKIGRKTWDDAIAEDFGKLKALGLSHPLMNDVLLLLNTGQGGGG